MSLEFILCVLIIIIVIGFFIEVNLGFKERLEKLPNIKEKLEIFRREYLERNNWQKYESKSTDNST